MVNEEIELTYLTAIDEKMREAERLLDMSHLDGDDEEEYLDEYERLFHCGVCTVREVLTVVWPKVDEYVDWLKSQIPGAADE